MAPCSSGVFCPAKLFLRLVDEFSIKLEVLVKAVTLEVVRALAGGPSGMVRDQERELDAVLQANAGISSHTGQIREVDNEMLISLCLSFSPAK